MLEELHHKPCENLPKNLGMDLDPKLQFYNLTTFKLS